MSYEIENNEPVEYQCRHIFTDGRRCASPTLRSPGGHEPFCYYHHTTRGAASMTPREPSASSNRRSGFTLPLPEDRSAIQHSIGEVLRRIAANEIDSRRAGLLLYGLQIASLNLKQARKISEEDAEDDLVTEITVDPDHGLLAPPAELHANEPMGSAQRLLMELGDVHDDPAPTRWKSNPRQYAIPPSDRPRSEPATPATISPANLTLDLQASVLCPAFAPPLVRPNGTRNQLQRSARHLVPAFSKCRTKEKAHQSGELSRE